MGMQGIRSQSKLHCTYYSTGNVLWIGDGEMGLAQQKSWENHSEKSWPHDRGWSKGYLNLRVQMNKGIDRIRARLCGLVTKSLQSKVLKVCLNLMTTTFKLCHWAALLIYHVRLRFATSQ